MLKFKFNHLTAVELARLTLSNCFIRVESYKVDQCRLLVFCTRNIYFYRTDTGVHALHSTCHVDLQSPTGEPYNIEYILLILNSYFFKSGIDVRVLNAQVVSDEFHARFDAIRRSYIYRIAIPKIKDKTSQALINIPIEELKSCYFLR